MIHRAIILAALGMLAINTHAGTATPPLSVSEIAPGLFVHAGVMELMTRGNEATVANVGFVIGTDALR